MYHNLFSTCWTCLRLYTAPVVAIELALPVQNILQSAPRLLQCSIKEWKRRKFLQCNEDEQESEIGSGRHLEVVVEDGRVSDHNANLTQKQIKFTNIEYLLYILTKSHYQNCAKFRQFLGYFYE